MTIAIHNCYYCGSTGADHPLKISDSFTANSVVKCPHSSLMCRECYALMFGDRARCLFWNEAKKDKKSSEKKPGWSLMFTRNTSWLLSAEESFPTFSDAPQTVEIDGKQITAIVMTNLPTRAQIRQWIIKPPEPPFTIAIAESGQKHIRFLAKQALGQEHFPVQFEIDTIHLYRPYFVSLLTAYEGLMELGFSKAEIIASSYDAIRMSKCFEAWQSFEAIVAHERTAGKATRLLQLVNYVAQKERSNESGF